MDDNGSESCCRNTERRIKASEKRLGDDLRQHQSTLPAVARQAEPDRAASVNRSSSQGMLSFTLTPTLRRIDILSISLPTSSALRNTKGCAVPPRQPYSEKHKPKVVTPGMADGKQGTLGSWSIGSSLRCTLRKFIACK